jgi:TolB-like protein
MRSYGLSAWILILGVCSILSAAVPATQPAANNKIVIFPFEVLGDVGRRAWMARAVQQSLASEVAHEGGLFPVSAAAPAFPLDTDSARVAAKALGGDVVIIGAFQFAGSDLRFTGQVLNVAKGQAMAGLKVSGDPGDLFEMEDELAMQVRHALRSPLASATTQPSIDNTMVFGQTAPEAGPADLYPPPSDASRFADQYNRYYYDQTNFYSGYPYYDGGFYSPFFYGGYYITPPYVIIGHDGYHHDGHGPAPAPAPPGMSGGHGSGRSR